MMHSLSLDVIVIVLVLVVVLVVVVIFVVIVVLVVVVVAVVVLAVVVGIMNSLFTHFPPGPHEISFTQFILFIEDCFIQTPL